MFNNRFCSLSRLARQLGAGLLCAGLATPLWAAEHITLCFENKMVLPWRTLAHEGLNFELLKRVEARLPVKFAYQRWPWKRCLAKLQANEVDGAFTVSYSEERRSFGAFPGAAAADTQPDPAMRMHKASYFLIRKKGSRIDWDGKQFKHVDGKIAFQLGYSIGEMLRAQQVAVDESNDTVHSVGRKVLVGRVAAAAVMDSDAAILMASPLARDLEMVETPLIERSYYLMLSRSMVKARRELAEQIWNAVAEVRDSKDYRKLVQAANAENVR
jgi:polar amino acid transport system substrate-binding protein